MHPARLAAALCALLLPWTTRAADPVNLAQSATARSWQPVEAVPEHDAARLNDGSLHSYWSLRAEDIPGDAGLEWHYAQTLSSLVVRYFDGRMARSAAAARTQQWATLQAWLSGRWTNLDATVIGEETSTVRYVFPPVNTTRIRLLFREPPDPELRRTPDRLGIYICELEAYANVPFQWVASGHVDKSPRKGGYEKLFNEAPAGDGHYDVAGPLVIDPKPSRVFRDTLRPNLIVAESRWAAKPCAVKESPDLIWLANGFLQLELSTKGGLHETGLQNLVTEEPINARDSIAFVLQTASGAIRADNLRVLGKDTSGSGADVARVRFDLAGQSLKVSVFYELPRKSHFCHKWLRITNIAPTRWMLRDITLSSLNLPVTPVDLMAGQELTYPVVKLHGGGFFSALEAVYWDHVGDTLTYYPAVSLDPGAVYTTEKAVVGIYKNTREQLGGWDRGVREWIAEYHAQISPVRPEWPDVYVEGWTANLGLKETRDKPEWTRRWFETARKLGVTDIDAYEPYHQAGMYSDEVLRQFAALAREHNIRTGMWFDHGADNNWHGTVVAKKPWACKLSPEAEADFRAVLDLIRTYGFKSMHWADFFTVWPCNATSHGHLPGKYSVYAQGQRMLQFARDVRKLYPDSMLGADGGFTNPQYARYVDSRMNPWWVDPADRFASIEPDIHLDRLVAGRNIPYVYGAHVTNLAPWFRILNWINHMGYESNQHDRAGYRYGLLAALALAGQVCFNSIPDEMPESEIAFTRKWLDWARTNRDYLLRTDRLFDRSLRFSDIWQGDADSLAGFSHMRSDRGFVFLLNPSPVPHTAELTLALATDSALEVREIYPGTTLTATGLRNGQTFKTPVPGKQVRVLWIGPAQSKDTVKPPADAGPRYLGAWRIARHDDTQATIESSFDYPVGATSWLRNPAKEADWVASPWAFDKAYLVLILKNEWQELNNNFIPDDLRITARVNGVERRVFPFKTRRYQLEGVTRCYFLELPPETRPGLNRVLLTLPISFGIAFHGAYLDLPDQMP